MIVLTKGGIAAPVKFTPQDRKHTLESTFPVPDHHHRMMPNHPQWGYKHPQSEGHKRKNRSSFSGVGLCGCVPLECILRGGAP